MGEASRRGLKVALVSDAFPPRCGGSGWSTYYLGKALTDGGHAVSVVRPVYVRGPGRAGGRRSGYGGLTVEEVYIPSPPGWMMRAGVGRAWEEEKGIRILKGHCARLALSGQVEVLHGQHQVSGLAATLGADAARKRGARVVSLVTVRDYWPLCPSSTRLLPGRGGKSEECNDCHNFGDYVAGASRNNRSRTAAFTAGARWLRTRSQGRTLAQADAIIAVSNYVQSELSRSRRFHPERLHTIPNLVDLGSVDDAVGGGNPVRGVLPGRYLLFAGKLDEHKGAQMLPEVIAGAGVRLPVLIAGDGPWRGRIQSEAQEGGVDFRFLDWLDNAAILSLMHEASCLLFPSCWQEPLSRVLLEGCAAGAAIVALDTGGTSDVITHKVNGWLAQDISGFIEGVAQVCSDDDLNSALRRGAREEAATKFAAPVVARQVEDLYRSLLARVRGA